MKPPIFVGTLSEEERKALEAGLRSSDAFVLRRCQILLASVRGERPPRIAENLGCGSQTVRNAIHAFNRQGLDALRAGSSRPREVHAAFDESGVQALREILHQDPRKYDKESSLWTLRMAAEVSFEEGITDRELSGETIRTTLERLGVRWERAKRWIESPDPEYARKKGSRPADPARREPSTLGCGFRGRDVVFSLRATFFAFVGRCQKAYAPP
jgi:transposase